MANNKYQWNDRAGTGWMKGKDGKWYQYKDHKRTGVVKKNLTLGSGAAKFISKNVKKAQEATRKSESAFRSAAKTTSGRGAGRSAFSTKPPKKNNKAERLDPEHEKRKKKRRVEGTPNRNAAFKNRVSEVKINKGENQTNNNTTTTSKEAPIRKVEKTAAEKHNEGIKRAQKNLPAQKEVVAKELEGKIRRMGMSGKRGIMGIKKRKAMEAEIKRLRKKKPDEERNKQGAH